MYIGKYTIHIHTWMLWDMIWVVPKQRFFDVMLVGIGGGVLDGVVGFASDSILSEVFVGRSDCFKLQDSNSTIIGKMVVHLGRYP